MIACACLGIGELALCAVAVLSGSAWLTSIINRVRYARHCACKCHNKDKHANCNNPTITAA